MDVKTIVDGLSKKEKKLHKKLIKESFEREILCNKVQTENENNEIKLNNFHNSLELLNSIAETLKKETGEIQLRMIPDENFFKA